MNIKASLKLYNAWQRMKQVCTNPHATEFEYYGGKGIVVCEEWDEFTNFANWSVNNGYNEGLILSRKTKNDDYSPETCEWITNAEHRKKKQFMITYENKEISLNELSERTGICKATLKTRYLNGRRGNDLVRELNRGLKVVV